MPASARMRPDRVLAALALLLTLALAASWAALRSGTGEGGGVARPDGAGPEAGLADSQPSVALALPHPAGSGAAAEGARSPAKGWSGDPVGVLLFGAVRAPSGEPLHEGTVVLERSGAAQLQVPFRGSYSVSGLAPGRWRVTWKRAGFFPETRELDLARDPQLVRVDVELVPEPRPRIRVLTPQGEPLRSALAHARLDVARLGAFASERRSPRTVGEGGRALGSFEAEPHKGPAGTSEWIGWIRLQRRLPVFVHLVYGEQVLATAEIESFPDGIDFEGIDFTCSLGDVLRALGSLRLHAVASSSRRSIAAPRVELRPAGAAARPSRVLDPWPGQVAAIPPGSHHVVVSAAGYLARSFEVRIDPGRVCDLGIVELQRAITIRGRAVDPQGHGRPVPIACLRRLEDGEGWQRVASSQASAAGQFQFPALPEGAYALRVEGDGPYAKWSGTGELVLGDGEASQPEVAVRLQATSTLVLRSSSKQVLDIAVRGALGIPLREGSVQPERRAAFRMAPGGYSITWSAPSGAGGTKQIVLGQEPLEIELGP